MNCSILLRGPFTVLFICLLCTAGWGSDVKSDCRAEKELLLSNEAELCNGFGYLFNPSACIKARKALTSLNAGECRQSAAGELPQQPALLVAPPVGQAPPVTAVSNPAPVAETLQQPGKTSAAAAVSGSEIDQLRQEIAALRAEVQQLRKEVAVIRAQQK